MELIILKEVEHIRKIDNDDLYFTVSVIHENNKIEMEVGWIEKVWDKEQFEKTTRYTVISVKEFSCKKDYDKWKYNLKK